MKIFFDTEFTGLHKDTTLISIGMVDINGRSFYAEFTDYDAHVDDWVWENVIMNLKWSKEGFVDNFINIYENSWEVCGDKSYVRNTLKDWLSKYDNIELVSDVCHYDMVLFIDIFGGAFDIPKTINPACHDINQDIARFYNISETEVFDKSREEILKDFNINIIGDKHNSLYDAKVIKEIYTKLN